MKKRTHIQKILAIVTSALVFIMAVPLMGMAVADDTEPNAGAAAVVEASTSPAAAEPGEIPAPSNTGEPLPSSDSSPSPEPSATPVGTEMPDEENAVLPSVTPSPSVELSLEPNPTPEPDSASGEVSISTADELLTFAKAINGGTCEEVYGVPAGEVQAALTADINLSGISFTPIGSLSHPFTGSFDGAGHMISNLSVSGDIGQGLFGHITDATIKNINLKSVNISARVFAGSVAGYAENSQIMDCSATGTVRAGENFAGGIAGAQIYGLISGCTTQSMTVSATESAGGVVGGAVGWYDKPCVITDCKSSASVSADWFVGGIAGLLDAADVQGSVFSGSVTCNIKAGGLVAGLLRTGASVSGCSSAMRVMGDSGDIKPFAQVGAVEE